MGSAKKFAIDDLADVHERCAWREQCSAYFTSERGALDCKKKPRLSPPGIDVHKRQPVCVCDRE